MDRFLAAISLEHDLPPGMPEVLQRAVLSTRLKPEAATSQWADNRVALVCTRAAHHSDTAFQGSTGFDADNPASLIYVNGPLSQPDIASTSCQSQCEMPYGERLAAMGTLFQVQASASTPDFKRLSGSFQALVYQPAARQVWLVADRMGSRTIFYCQAGGMLLAASDIRLLLALRQVSPVLDLEGLSQFVRYQMILGSGTLYREIKTVPGGHFLTVGPEPGGFRLAPYWTMEPLPYYATRAEAIEATAQAFITATRRSLQDSQKPGLLLSGGMDSRMLVASIDETIQTRLRTYTFGEAESYETAISQRVAEARHLPWQFIPQSLEQYWQGLDEDVALTNGLHSLAHTHLRYPATQLAADGCDTILHGWAFDAFHSGSYLPKRNFHVLGRTLTDYSLARLADQQAVVGYLHSSLDIQKGQFENSMFRGEWRERWQNSPRQGVKNQIAILASRSPVPYDWIDYALFGQELARFRSTPMMTTLRAVARERSPLFENEVIESYLRLPNQWRFLGPVFRQALNRLNPAVMSIPYSNLRVSPLAPPLLQALSLQSHATWRANKERLAILLENLKLKQPVPHKKHEGNYLSSAEMVKYLDKTDERAAHIVQLLERGPLAEAGLFDPNKLQPILQKTGQGDNEAGFTLMSWISLALWFDNQPLQLS